MGTGLAVVLVVVLAGLAYHGPCIIYGCQLWLWNALSFSQASSPQLSDLHDRYGQAGWTNLQTRIWHRKLDISSSLSPSPSSSPSVSLRLSLSLLQRNISNEA